MPSPQNAALVRAAQAGDDAAWNTLYPVFYPMLYAKAITICRDHALAKDMVQEAFVTAWLKLSQLKDPHAFEAWVKKILVHLCYKNVDQWQMNSVDADDPVQIIDTIEQKLDASDDATRLMATMASLSENLRTTVLLRYFSSFGSYEDIARILTIPVGTVRSRLNEAKSKLSQHWHNGDQSYKDVLKESREWDQFYHSTFSGMHFRDTDKGALMHHLGGDAEIITPVKRAPGHHFFEERIHDDRQVGSYVVPLSVISSGNVSVMEATHHNPPHLKHCPDLTVLVFFRKGARARKIHLQVN